MVSIIYYFSSFAFLVVSAPRLPQTNTSCLCVAGDLGNKDFSAKVRLYTGHQWVRIMTADCTEDMFGG